LEKRKRKDPLAVALGRRGGKKSGPARMKKIPPEVRREIARKAVMARWARAKQTKGQSTGSES
jgi:hypothetical protein